ncbi:MAG: Protein-export membrane protein SecF [Methanonatronarchaeales archaeon]|nr:Protein-export membrane protein SecF [Methanonatronarchaeales archaeon]
MRLPDLMKLDERLLIAPPLLLILLAVSLLGYGYVTTGTPLELGMDFRGGVAVTVTTEEAPEQVAAGFEEFGVVGVRDLPDGALIQFGPIDDALKEELESSVSARYDTYQITAVSEVFGSELQGQALTASVIAFLAMAGMVLLLFRRLFPAGTIVVAALGDILVAAGFVRLSGLQLSLGTVAALLMLIGYSVDSNVLLTSRMLRGRGTVSKRFNGAFRTGATMAVTTLSAILVLATVSYVAGMTILFEITAVLFAGLVADVLNTWFLNGSVLRSILVREGVEVS